ncbi:IS110 family transposase, partial [Acinetobacter sp. Lyrl_1]
MIMLGIDVSKTKIDCCIFPQGLTGKRKNKIFTNT